MFSFWKKKNRTEAAPIELVPVVERPLAYRRFLRSAFHAKARLNFSGYLREVQLLDVSLKGALVDLGQVLPCPVGARGRLRLSLSTTTFIAMDVSVARVEGSQLGLKCTHIDLDSVTHLRQLIERNSQDPALLVRELALLTGGA
ncbi:MAG TPA: PilZ domain-containing protein [Rhodoferax sp.]|jgi:hypothetical protein|nr:PilZ domain-containing protein [Rhodoferax sp.]HQY76622.1 PilZ domain-containing protein [Rhodoferax sp.]